MSALCAAGGYSTVSQANAVAALVAHIRQTVVNVEVAAATKAPPVIAPPEGLS